MLLLFGRRVQLAGVLVRAVQRAGRLGARQVARRRLGRSGRGGRGAARLLTRKRRAERERLLAAGKDDFALRLVARELPVPTLQRVADAAHEHYRTHRPIQETRLNIQVDLKKRTNHHNFERILRYSENFITDSKRLSKYTTARHVLLVLQFRERRVAAEYEDVADGGEALQVVSSQFDCEAMSDLENVHFALSIGCYPFYTRYTSTNVQYITERPILLREVLQFLDYSTVIHRIKLRYLEK